MKKRLERLRAELLNKRSEITNTLSTERDTMEVSSHGDLVDQSANYAEREMLLGITEHDVTLLKEIDTALKGIDEGTYGICEECSSEIPEARLIALPTTTLCLNCQASHEKKSGW